MFDVWATDESWLGLLMIIVSLCFMRKKWILAIIAIITFAFFLRKLTQKIQTL
jgi:hypothetical protein